MIRSVTVTNVLGESIKMELAKPEKSGFAVYSIDGLGPVTGSINIASLATADGGIFHSARLPSRNILMTLGLLFAETVEEARHLSYRYFPVKKPVSLSIETDQRICDISGYVEANEIDIFSREETAQISILCPNPYFFAGGERRKTEVTFAVNTSTFAFPFGNELSESTAGDRETAPGGLQFGLLTDDSLQTIWYEGDADTGFEMILDAAGAIGGKITVANAETQEAMVLDMDKVESMTGAGFGLGDSIEVSTVRGEKRITLIRNGNRTNILGCLEKDSDWLLLRKGDNIFQYAATSGGVYLGFRVRYDTLYEGV